MTVGEADIDVRIRLPEFKLNTGIDGGPLFKQHVHHFLQRYTTGVGANKVGAVYSGRQTISGATPIDLSGSLSSLVDGTTVSFPILMGIFAVNFSTTAGQTITMGGGSNPLASWVGATGDLVKIGPAGFLNLWNPIDGYAVVAGTGDILNFDTLAGTPELGLMLVGRLS
jgi:hypothetical protein